MSFLEGIKAWVALGNPEQTQDTNPAGLDQLSDNVAPLPATGNEKPANHDFTAVRPLGPVGDSGMIQALGSNDQEPLSNTSLKPIPVPDRPTQGIGTVKPVPATSGTPQLVTPRSFEDSEGFGDRLRSGESILLNLREVDVATARRILDFCAGLCYGTRASMERSGKRVFLLVPAEVHLSADDHQAIRDSGLI